MNKKLENFLNVYFGQKAPSLPANIKELLVKLNPYFSILSLIFLLIAFIPSLILLPLSALGGSHLLNFVNFALERVLILVLIVLEIKAIPGLFKRQLSAWRLLFWISLINLLDSLLKINLGGFIVGGIISFYFLFQVKPLYK